jgi:hypothetical protein
LVGVRTLLLRIIAKLDETDPIQPYEYEARRKLDLFRLPRRFVNTKYEEFLERVSAARQRLEKELELPATLLLGKDPDPQLVSEADRLKAERELRLAVVPRYLLIFGYLGLNQSCWWWLAQIRLSSCSGKGIAEP